MQVKAAVETEILPAALQGNRGAVQCLLTMNGDAVDEAFEKEPKLSKDDF